jgi:hypothetical protein
MQMFFDVIHRPIAQTPLDVIVWSRDTCQASCAEI